VTSLADLGATDDLARVAAALVPALGRALGVDWQPAPLPAWLAAPATRPVAEEPRAHVHA
jgi:hypothetical protein